jgi:tRNA pseudouridine38-40 synthase
MQRCFLYIEFVGAVYNGWQKQPNVATVQEEIEKALQVILRRKDIEIFGSGRTDAGVNASGQVAHIDLDENVNLKKLQFQLNGLLPRSIHVFAIKPVKSTVHARFEATSRTYQYRLLSRPSPIRESFAWYYPYKINPELLSESATYIESINDFTPFSKENPGNIGSTFCTIEKAVWTQQDEIEWMFEIKANRFLRHMVRYLVGAMAKVASGTISLQAFQASLKGENPNYVHLKAPAHALTLTQVSYPDSIFL